MRAKSKAVLIFTAIALFVLFLYRVGFFGDPNYRKILVDAFFPSIVRNQLIVVGILLPLFIAWIFFRNEFDKPK